MDFIQAIPKGNTICSAFVAYSIWFVFDFWIIPGLTYGGIPVNHDRLCTIFIHVKALSRQFKRDKLFAKRNEAESVNYVIWLKSEDVYL